LLGYYAWQNQFEPNVPADGSGFSSSLVSLVQSHLSANNIIAYPGDQCFYRAFISDNNASPQERNTVRRNHVYVLDVKEFLGPGISDLNDIIVLGRPVLPSETYVSSEIHVLDWHRVFQDIHWGRIKLFNQ